jgi:hypothetical protein
MARQISYIQDLTQVFIASNMPEFLISSALSHPGNWMIRDSAETIAVIIIAAMVLAATTPIFVGARVDGMSLRARDIGFGWQENDRFSPGNYTFEGPLIYSQDIVFSNETSIVVSELYYSNSSEAILQSFNSHRIRYSDTSNDVDIGEMGYIFGYGKYSTVSYLVIIDGQGFYANRSNIVRLEFKEGNVLSIITVSVKGVHTPTQPWIWDFTLDLGERQLQKIDRYLSY